MSKTTFKLDPVWTFVRGRRQPNAVARRQSRHFRAFTFVVPIAAGGAVVASMIFGAAAASVPVALPSEAQIGAGVTGSASSQPPPQHQPQQQQLHDETRIIPRENPIVIVDDDSSGASTSTPATAGSRNGSTSQRRTSPESTAAQGTSRDDNGVRTRDS